MTTWIFATETTRIAGTVRLARSIPGEITVVAVGPREVADAAAAAGPDKVLWAATDAGRPPEALAGPLASAAACAAPRLLLGVADPAARALLGAAAATTGAAAVTGAIAFRAEGERLAVDRLAQDGALVVTETTDGPLAALVLADDAPADATTPAPIELLPADTVAELRVTGREATPAAAGLHGAARVVSVGRGLRSRDDLVLVEKLAGVLGAEIGCTMPVADDLGWVAKERYVGRSGQKIAPRLYLALGISGMPQHLEGVRDAKVVAAVNTDPNAPIFRAAGYGIVGDLYEVVPALIDALSE
jgi:electron transfer flavoprotein alpha subunit